MKSIKKIGEGEKLRKSILLGVALGICVSTALFNVANAAGVDSVEIGDYAHATGANSIVISGGKNADVPGSHSEGYSLNDIVIGNNSYTWDNGTEGATGNIILGVNGNITTGVNNIGLGAGVTINASAGTAVGAGSIVNNANSVALGASSATGAAHAGATATTGSFTLNGNTTTSNYAGAASDAAGTVSVGTAGAERQIQNVAAGDISAGSTDAVNGSQLYATNQAVNKLNDQVTTNTTDIGNLKTQVNTNTTDIANLKTDMTTVKNDITNIKGDITNIKGDVTNIKGDITNINNALNTGYTFGGDNASDSVAIGKELDIKGDGKNITTSFSKDAATGNATIKVEMSANPDFDSIKVGGNTYIDNNGINANDKKVTNVADGTIAAGSKDAVNGGQLVTYVGDTNNYSSTNTVVNGDNVVNNLSRLDGAVGDVNNYGSNNYVTNGSSVTDSIGALDKQVGINSNNINALGNQLGNLDSRVDKVGAGAAALAALHPLEFDPDAKWDISAGGGHYNGQTAFALGAFYRPDENVMFSLGGTIGNGENMINLGATFKLDGKNRVSRSKVAMAKELVDLRTQMQMLSAKVNGLTGNGALGGTHTSDFPDVEANHWAYEYVNKLAEAGIIEGYPDGYFRGQQNISRYEMATIIYRALHKGVTVDSKALAEFKPELDRISVDQVSKNIERVRVIKGRG